MQQIEAAVGGTDSENDLLRKENAALMAQIEAAIGEEAVGCADKEDEWTSRANIDTDIYCALGMYQRKCAKSCCVSNEGCSHSSCTDCVSANDNGQRVCDWVGGACSEVPAGTHWKKLKVSGA